ncbi:MAG: cellulase family glycosylhydrolase [Acidobacteriota bacterium]|nr:cellulase family glycosylhydrolase [Acidobacteriota bacterium]
MVKRLLLMAALAISVGAAFFILRERAPNSSVSRDSFVRIRGSRFVVDGRPFRFVGANVAVLYGNDELAQMANTLHEAARTGVAVVRVWAFGESGKDDGTPSGVAPNEWLRINPFRRGPEEWNEDAFVSLDRIIAEAARNNLRVQLCLTNWWRDTGGVVRYLRWAGLPDAADETQPYGINAERAMVFYTNSETRRFYREHLQRLALRRNTVTGVLYRDDPTIFGWELMNEAQAVTGRWTERRAWIAEMSAYLKSLDPNHIIAPGDWGYRTAAERREWLLDHQLLTIDYCDVHNYPRDDLDSFVDSPNSLREFIDNRAAAAFSVDKPLVFGEFGMVSEGYNGFSQTDWFRAFFEGNVRSGSAGAMFWIFTPDSKRGYGVTYTTSRDQGLFSEIRRASQMFAVLASADPPERLLDGERHLVPRQFAWTRSLGDPARIPQMIVREDRSILYRFKPQMATAMRFEKIGGGPGYIWGGGAGFVEYIVPARDGWRRVSRIVVRAHLQPVLPTDAKPETIKTRVTLFVDGANLGSRLVSVEPVSQPVIKEWRIDGFFARLRAQRGQPLTIRFAVTPESDWLYGLNISNWPEGYDSHQASPLELEIRR